MYLTEHQALKWVKKINFHMIWTQSILMPSKARLKFFKKCSCMNNGDKKTIKYQN